MYIILYFCGYFEDIPTYDSINYIYTRIYIYFFLYLFPSKTAKYTTDIVILFWKQ